MHKTRCPIEFIRVVLGNFTCDYNSSKNYFGFECLQVTGRVPVVDHSLPRLSVFLRPLSFGVKRELVVLFQITEIGVIRKILLTPKMGNGLYM